MLLNALEFDNVGTDAWERKSKKAALRQELNALLPMLVTLFGITTEARE
jgi:hypothetical protein